MGADPYSYDVALSFAGSDRPYVHRVAERLKGESLRVFYDQDEEVALWGEDLVELLDAVYREKARFVVMFVSEAYRDREWTRFERKSALARALTERSAYVLPARFDHTALPGLRPTIGYLSLETMTPEDLADRIVRKVTGLQQEPPEEDAGDLSLIGTDVTLASAEGQGPAPIPASSDGPPPETRPGGLGESPRSDRPPDPTSESEPRTAESGAAESKPGRGRPEGADPPDGSRLLKSIAGIPPRPHVPELAVMQARSRIEASLRRAMESHDLILASGTPLQFLAEDAAQQQVISDSERDLLRRLDALAAELRTRRSSSASEFNATLDQLEDLEVRLSLDLRKRRRRPD
jgi:hypothetical protein